jgi:hypothetical protein
MAKVYAVPMPLAMGRLLSGGKKTLSWPAVATSREAWCEKCGTQTGMGRNYTFRSVSDLIYASS